MPRCGTTATSAWRDCSKASGPRSTLILEPHDVMTARRAQSSPPAISLTTCSFSSKAKVQQPPRYLSMKSSSLTPVETNESSGNQAPMTKVQIPKKLQFPKLQTPTSTAD